MNMKKKAIAAALMMSMVAGSSLTVCAAPETMADGTVFDAEFYAQMYPDVVAALGTSADAMYQHYVMYGKAEGRLAFSSADAAQQAVPVQQGSYDITVWHNGDTVEESYVRMAPDAPWELLSSEPCYDAEGWGWTETNWGSYIGIKKIINGEEHIMELNSVAPGMDWVETFLLVPNAPVYHEYRLWEGYSEGRTPTGAVIYSGNDGIGSLEWFD